MFNLKKLLAGVLGAAMVMTSMTALADEPETDATPNTITGARETGTLTINKTDNSGTALSGVTFTVYKLADITVANGAASVTMSTYIDDVLKEGATLTETDLEAIANSNNTSAAEWAALTAKIDFDDDDMVKLKADKQITDEDGKAVFDSLPLGIYAVAETDAPAHVIEKSANFIVSIPMTDTTGDYWVYDIVTTPKNDTALGGVTLQKKGKVGTSESTSTVNLSGATFVLQKKVDDEWVDATYTSGTDVGELTTNEYGKINVQNLPYGTYRFIETSVGSGYIMDGAATYEFEIKQDNTVEYDGEVLGDTDAIEVINYKPDLDKQVKVEGTDNYVEATDYSVGDDVEYKLTVYVPDNIEKLTTFKVTDTPTHLNDDSNTIVITCGTATLTKGTEYTVVDSDDGYGFTITFVPSEMENYADQDITITYKAKLLESAETTTEGNPNTATLTYSNNILPSTDDADDDNPNGDKTPSENTIEDDAVVYTFMLKVHKQNGDGEALAGVEFDVYSYSGTAANPTETELTEKGKKIKSITTDENGNASVSGLENGKYYLVETKTNDGYNLLKNPEAVTLSVSYETTWTATNTYDEDGNLVKHEESERTETFGSKADENSNGFVLSTVVNKKGFTLPSTGGMGSIIFIVGGIALAMAGLLIILASNKKAAAK